MTTWFTADLHFGHANIIDYSGRPFADVAAMNRALIERWNAAVRPDDTVWVLGDVVLGRIDESLGLVSELSGCKRLLAGNHDRCWAGHGRRAEDWTERYLAAGFAEVHQGEVAIAVGEHRVLACHFPYRGDSHDYDRYVEHRPADHGAWLLHGHVHERWRQRGRMINVGVDAWSCAPVAEATLAALIDGGPNDLVPLPSGDSQTVRDQRRAADHTALRFEPLDWPGDASAVVRFLTSNEWPFHGVSRLSAADAETVGVVGDDIATYWVREGDETVGMIRLFDLDDLDDGSPLFDLRIAERHRGRGIGRHAVGWLTHHLFTTYPTLHRIEATTRDDNAAMRAVFARCGYRLEGRLLEAWKQADGTRFDTLLYAILRREHAAAPAR